jgi:hypothetical protein
MSELRIILSLRASFVAEEVLRELVASNHRHLLRLMVALGHQPQLGALLTVQQLQVAARRKLAHLLLLLLREHFRRSCVRQSLLQITESQSLGRQTGLLCHFLVKLRRRRENHRMSFVRLVSCDLVQKRRFEV